MKITDNLKVSLPYITALRSELEVKNGHARLTVQGPSALLKQIVRGLRSFELSVRSPDELLVRCLYTKGLPAFEFWCVSPNMVTRLGSGQPLTSLSIWRKDAIGKERKCCERPAQLFIPAPAETAANLAFASRPTTEPLPNEMDMATADENEMMVIANDGPAIRESNYWDSPLARAGKFAISLNAGTLRVLVPDNQQHLLPEMLRGASWIQIEALPLAAWSAGRPCTQWTFEDFTASPFVLELSPGAFVEAIPKHGENFTIAFWIRDHVQPRLYAQLPGHWVTKPSLPRLNWAR